MTITTETRDLLRTAAQAASDKLGSDIKAIDVSARLPITEAFLLVSASNERQVNGVVDGIEEAMIKIDRRPLRREGRSEGRWVLLDYNDFIVHVQHLEDREYYSLDKLWGDCPSIELDLDREIPAAGNHRDAENA